jgi:hypothetical protein
VQQSSGLHVTLLLVGRVVDIKQLIEMLLLLLLGFSTFLLIAWMILQLDGQVPAAHLLPGFSCTPVEHACEEVQQQADVCNS